MYEQSPSQPLKIGYSAEHSRDNLDLSSERIGAESGRLEELFERIRQLASERGSLRARPDAQAEQVLACDRALSELLEQNRDLLASDPEIVSRLHEEAFMLQEKERLAGLQAELLRISTKAGESQARELNTPALEAADAELDKYLASQKDLFARYPGLESAVHALCAAGEQAGVSRRLEADQRAIKIYKSMIGVFNDHASICKVLSGLDQSERELLSQAYRQRYGNELTATLEKGFKGEKLEAIKSLLAGDEAAAAAARLSIALHALPFKRVQAVTDVLDSIGQASLPEVRLHFEKLYAARLGVRSASEALDKRIKKGNAEILKAELEGNMPLARALEVERELSGGTKRALVLYRTLEKMEPPQVADLQAAYARRFGCNLRDYLARTLPEGAQRDRTLSLLDGDQVRAYASRLRCRLMGHKGEWIGGPFQTGQATERIAVIDAYNEMYQRDFWKDLKKGLRKRDYDLMVPLIKDGEVSAAVLLYHCMLGIGTDEQGIMKILANASKTEIEEIKRSYSEHYRYRDGTGRNLLHDLRMELSGDARFDVMELMQGSPTSSREIFERMMVRYHHERSGSLIRRFDLFTKEGKVMDRDVQAAAEYYQSHIKDGFPGRREDLRFQALAALAGQDFDSFRNIKVWVANNAANMAAGSVAGAVTFLTVTMGAPIYVVVATAGAASMAARALMKLNIKGGAYGREELIRDTLLAAIDGGTLFMGRMLSNALAQKTLKMAASMGLKQAVGLTQYINRVRTAEHLIATRLDAEKEQAPQPLGSVPNPGPKLGFRDALDESFDSAWEKATSSVKPRE